MDLPMKKLTRVQLVNWHFFENERIAFGGSALISGDNTTGKSTILDAIQMVLTTNSRRFNQAANEKGNRDLRGYVRCKVGNVGEPYRRKGTVPANVALEFYEEKTESYFVLGVHLLSTDEESAVVKKWYAEECRLEDLSFITDGRPSLAEEFRCKTRQIKFMDTDKAARERFRHRMGNLEERFFDIIPKSLAFKPMDHVKDFINKFVLSEGRVDVESLRNNISVLDELEHTFEKTKNQLAALNRILGVFDQIEKKDRDILINDILLKLSGRDAAQLSLEKKTKAISVKSETVSGIEDRLQTLEQSIKGLEEEILDLNVSIRNNESSRLVEGLRTRQETLAGELKNENDAKRILEREIAALVSYVKTVNELLHQKLERQGDIGLYLQNGYEDEKARMTAFFTGHFETDFQSFVNKRAQLSIRLEEMDGRMTELRNRQASLEKRQLSYPVATMQLKGLIEKEFAQKGITSKVYILSDLLEITDETWRNAVEGYLNTQKFYLVVEPEHYQTALEVYDKNRDKIHSAGIINTRKLPLDQEENTSGLAYVVKTENRYAKAYIRYVLGRVIRCERAQDLEEHSIAITPGCMLYQGYVVRHLNPKDYKDPYIGINAFRVQLENVKKSIEELALQRKELREEMNVYAQVLATGTKVKPEMIKLYQNVPSHISLLESQIACVKAELQAAQQDPTLIELTMKLDDKEKLLSEQRNEKDRQIEEKARLKNQIRTMEEEITAGREELARQSRVLEEIYEEAGSVYAAAQEKYDQNRKTKEPQRIFENFSPQKTQFENEKNALVKDLYNRQSSFNAAFSLDMTTGTEDESQYREAADKLAKIEIVKYEEKLKSARADCEKVFRSDFLSKMKEHIESARQEFRNLNKALENVYYGEDSYHFTITYDKRKESLYRMITSEYNMEGESNLWTNTFETEYKDEIEDLFSKLMAGDDMGERVIEEYTDYRSYLDYDIEVRKRNGQRQRFSEIYGEKSGSETQVPYYVAIAASFYQLYRFGNSVRLMLLDEAFDKMDDDRIGSMLEFMNSLNLQVIMATPPPKIEVIGQQVDCVLTVLREGDHSFVEEYEL
ncbi:MAG: cell division protein MukB [Lachnospiraceae bacterium]|nr:cell division protein MukB [Lachnospiraceae bacterium]